jgi:UDP-GlcNAc:undecaprenyl-phosphate/decaprenyl-phosphate GlcNAc-1-phosphate transferase
MSSLPAIVLTAVAGLLTVMLCLFAMRIGTMFNLLDIPGDRKKHKQVTPLMGGVVLLTAFIPAAIALVVLAAEPAHFLKLSVWLAAIAGMTLVGILDDRHSLSPRLRLVMSFLIFGFAAFIEPIYNVRVLDFEHPPFTLGLGTRGIAIVFTVVCCVGLVNAVNMADGKNGLVIGLCIGWLGLLALRSPAIFLPLIGMLVAILFVLLAFNLRGKLFLGDGGAYGFAGTIAILAIAIYNSPGEHATRALSGEEVMLLFAVPVLDSFRLTYKRMRRGQSPMAADRDHFHHHLQDRLGWPTGLIAYWIAALLPASLILATL